MAIKIVQNRGIATEKNIKGSHLLLVLDDVAAKAFPYLKELGINAIEVIANGLGLTVFELFDRVREQSPPPKKKGRRR